MNDFKIEEIESSKHLLLLRTINLIKSCLPPDQIADKSEFLKAFKEKKKWFPDNFHLLIIRNGDVVVAATAGYYIGDINTGFVNYIVVDENYKRKGLASMLRQELINLFCNDAKNNSFESPEGYLGEVEHNNPWLKTLIKKIWGYSSRCSLCAAAL